MLLLSLVGLAWLGLAFTASSILNYVLFRAVGASGASGPFLICRLMFARAADVVGSEVEIFFSSRQVQNAQFDAARRYLHLLCLSANPVRCMLRQFRVEDVLVAGSGGWMSC